MDVSRRALLFLFGFFVVCIRVFSATPNTANTLNAANNSILNTCLNKSSSYTHRLEKENTIRNCFQDLKNHISRDNCFSSLDKFKVSNGLSEELKSICFYETTLAKNFKGCLTETKKFKGSYNHDDAIFFCVQQFQDNVTSKDCLGAANQMIFPLKKQYLVQHCNSDIF